MPLKDLFVMGVHLGGAGGRKRSARFIHALLDNSQDTTICGVDVGGWSRKFLPRKKVQELLTDMVCKTCAGKVGLS